MENDKKDKIKDRLLVQIKIYLKQQSHYIMFSCNTIIPHTAS
jgi:hypothetical protein